VQKIVGEILSSSAGIAFSKEARDVLIECCVEFITLISSEANEISEKETKKTIACDHIIKALDQLGFPDYVPAVLEAAAEHKEVQKVREPNFLFTNCRKLTKRTRDAKRRQINLSRAASA
jgi:histone H3/H4